MMRKLVIPTIVAAALLAALFLVIPVKVKQTAWTPESLLSRPAEQYTDAALMKTSDLVRADLLIERARSEYYGALFAKDYVRAHACLSGALRSRLTQQQFKEWFEAFVGSPSNMTDEITLNGLRNIKLLREYPIEMNGIRSKASIMALFVNSTIKGKEAAVQTLALLDAWSVSDGKAYVVPAEFATIAMGDRNAK